MKFGIDYTKAPVPNLAYFSDYCDVRRLRDGLLLVFGKLNGSGNALRTQVEIAFPQQMFDRQLWRVSGPLRDTLRGLVSTPTPEHREQLGDPEKVQTFAANNVFFATGGEESVLDFYYLSPRGVFLASRDASSGVTDFEPVIRISSDAALLKEFLERCEPFVKEATYDSSEFEQLASSS